MAKSNTILGIPYSVMIGALLWAIWLIVATIFYAIYDDYGFYGGFYYAISIGYGLGYTYKGLTEDYNSMMFSGFYMIASVFAYSFIIVMATRINLFSGEKKWYTNYIRKKQAEKDHTEISWWENFKSQFSNSSLSFFTWNLILVVVLSGGGILFFYEQVDYTGADAFYTVASTITGVGIADIGVLNDDWVYVVYGLYAFFGCLAFKIVIFYVDEWWLAPNWYLECDEVAEERLTADELKVITELGIGDGMGRGISRAEFIILILSRAGIFDYQLVHHINEKYHSFDGRPINDSYDDRDIVGGGKQERIPLVTLDSNTKSTSGRRI